jgi:16S rRNA (uracil1498-N3)-methyltransferase
MANLYYREDLSRDALAVGASIEIVGQEARHAVRVSRLRVQERILIGNGAGALARCEVTSTAKDHFTARVLGSQVQAPPAQQLVLVQALAKGDRDERAVEQATEFGVDTIVPWQAARSVSRWQGSESGVSDKAAKGLAKWARIAREASKQSLRARIPSIRSLVTTDALCKIAGAESATVLVLHPQGDSGLSEWSPRILPSAVRDIYLVVGPEGGISDDELSVLRLAGATVHSLGEQVLRTSSAGPAGLAVMNIALGRW